MDSQLLFLADAVPELVWAIDADTRKTFLNKHFRAFVGADGERETDTWTNYLHPEEGDRVRDAWDRAFREQAAFETRCRLRRSDGAFRWVEVRGALQFDENGKPVRWIGVNRDIDDDVNAQAALATANDNLEKAAAAIVADRARLWRLSQDILVIADSAGKWLDVNPAAETIFGRARDEILAASPNGFVHPDDLGKTIKYRKGNLEVGDQGTLEQRIIDGAGNTRIIAWTATVESERFYATGRDITEQREKELQLSQIQKMDAIGQLTGGVAHDFNNLLTVILGSLEELVEAFPSGTDLHEKAAGALSAAEQGAELTSRLLAFARRQPLEPRALKFGSKIANVQKLLRPLLGETIAVTTAVPEDLWTATADPGQLESAILNLCINARDAMPRGGTLTIEAANMIVDSDYAAQNHDVAPGNYVMLAVTDTGTGMTPETARLAFDPFFTTKPVGAGSGLGLSMVYGFAKQSGGYAKIYSEIGHGTTVKLYLPRATNAASAEPTVSSETERGGSESILLVEDDDLLRAHVEKTLQSLGYRVTVASDGPSALVAMAAMDRVDLLLTMSSCPAA